jgi:hypothetical protein
MPKHVLKSYTMLETRNRARVAEYVEWQAKGEIVQHAEKVRAEHTQIEGTRLLGREYSQQSAFHIVLKNSDLGGCKVIVILVDRHTISLRHAIGRSTKAFRRVKYLGSCLLC